MLMMHNGATWKHFSHSVVHNSYLVICNACFMNLEFGVHINGHWLVPETYAICCTLFNILKV
jgi:hypothetical protein